MNKQEIINGKTNLNVEGEIVGLEVTEQMSVKKALKEFPERQKEILDLLKNQEK